MAVYNVAEKPFLDDTEKPRKEPTLVYVLKDCIGTLISFESQVKMLNRPLPTR